MLAGRTNWIGAKAENSSWQWDDNNLHNLINVKRKHANLLSHLPNRITLQQRNLTDFWIGSLNYARASAIAFNFQLTFDISLLARLDPLFMATYAAAVNNNNINSAMACERYSASARSSSGLEPSESANFSQGSAEEKAKIYYESCLDRNDTVESRGTKPMQDLIESVSSIAS